MNINPLELQRLAVRIESLQRTSTAGWDAGDDYELRMMLPDSRVPMGSRTRLPLPEKLRELSLGENEISLQDYRTWNSWCMNLEQTLHRNRPGSPQKMMRDMARGKFPK